MKRVGKLKVCNTNKDGGGLRGCCFVAPIFSQERRQHLAVPERRMEGLGNGTYLR